MTINDKNRKSDFSLLREALRFPVILDFGQDSIFSQFSCIPNCEKCCSYSYFLPFELDKLPHFIKEKLILNEEKYEIIQENGKCIFYQHSRNNYFFCSIYQIRPIRCRIYPFFPLVVNKRIIITLEPALKMLNDTDRKKVCPGIGVKGKSVVKIKNECLFFLKKLQDSPLILKTMIVDNYKFNRIRDDRWFYNYFEQG